MTTEFIKNQLTASLFRIVLSGPRKKNETYSKIIIKPFMKNHQLFFQFESFTSTQAFHHNLSASDAADRLMTYIEANTYRQINGETATESWQMLFSKKGKVSFKEQKNSLTKKTDLNHNRKKHYLLEEGKPVPFLVSLGVMTDDGRVVKRRYDKFRQINRFLEMVEDVVSSLPTERSVKIIDFGCGRSYLTFALYHYLVTVKGMSVQMIGLDLKEKVIEDCNQLADKCGYKALHFEHGDIVDYDKTQDVDMVVTLHACDTATDLALQKATAWGAKVIMSVPCCQHEWHKTIDHGFMKDIFQYGIIKERMAALMTDAMRSNWLKLHGYDVDIMEFIDVAHTPKNLLIRALKMKDIPEDAIDYTAFDEFVRQFNGDLTIRKN